jgi:hypothetical protein
MLRPYNGITPRRLNGDGGLGFFAEEFDVGWAFLDWRALSALDLFADLLDDVGVG